MEKYLSQIELIKSIELNVNKLESGELNLSDIEKHLSLVRELYERTIALRYKAFELHSSVEATERIVEENAVSETIIEEVEVKEEVFFDINNQDVESDVKIDVIEESIVESNESSEIEFDFFNQTEEIVVTNSTSDIETVVSVVEEDPSIETSQIDEFLVETPVIEPIVEEVISISNTNTLDSEISQLFKRIDFKVKNQIGLSSLSSLIGSFGLNERLLYINELFDGSSESFSDAVKQIDTRHDLSEATKYVVEVAEKFNWEIESETVEEFIQKVCRRYA
mgnify:CR=1 FL=1